MTNLFSAPEVDLRALLAERISNSISQPFGHIIIMYVTVLSNQIEPIHNHHSFHQVPLHVQVYTVILVALDTHIPRAKVVDAPHVSFVSDCFFKQHEGLVSLRDNVFVRFVFPRCIRCDEETVPVGPSRTGDHFY